MNIEIAKRKEKRRAKKESWRERTGKQKPLDGVVFLNGEYIGHARRMYWRPKGGTQ